MRRRETTSYEENAEVLGGKSLDPIRVGRKGGKKCFPLGRETSRRSTEPKKKKHVLPGKSSRCADTRRTGGRRSTREGAIGNEHPLATRMSRAGTRPISKEEGRRIKNEKGGGYIPRNKLEEDERTVRRGRCLLRTTVSCHRKRGREYGTP